MAELSHMQIVAAITEIAIQVIPTVLAEDDKIHADSMEDAEAQLKQAVIEVLKQPNSAPTDVDVLAFWPAILKETSIHNRMIFIALVRAIYN